MTPDAMSENAVIADIGFAVRFHNPVNWFQIVQTSKYHIDTNSASCGLALRANVCCRFIA